MLSAAFAANSAIRAEWRLQPYSRYSALPFGAVLSDYACTSACLPLPLCCSETGRHAYAPYAHARATTQRAAHATPPPLRCPAPAISDCTRTHTTIPFNLPPASGACDALRATTHAVGTCWALLLTDNASPYLTNSSPSSCLPFKRDPPSIARQQTVAGGPLFRAYDATTVTARATPLYSAGDLATTAVRCLADSALNGAATATTGMITHNSGRQRKFFWPPIPHHHHCHTLATPHYHTAPGSARGLQHHASQPPGASTTTSPLPAFT